MDDSQSRTSPSSACPRDPAVYPRWNPITRNQLPRPMMHSRAALTLLLLAGCASAAPGGTPSSLAGLEAEVRGLVAAAAGDTAEVAVAFLDLATGDSLLIDAHTVMHAASTMKVPVMMELYRRAQAGEISLDDAVPVTNRFVSIAGGG